MVVGRIFDLRVAAPPALTIYEWQRGANDLRVVVPSAVRPGRIASWLLEMWCFVFCSMALKNSVDSVNSV
jgi:hypothetical protein